MIDNSYYVPTKKLSHGIVSVFLLVVLVGLFFANHSIMDSAYNHINQHSQEKLLFSDYVGNVFYTAIHFMLPINMTNLSLWGDVEKNDAYIFCLLILLLISSSVVLVLKSKRKLLYQLPIIISVSAISLMFFEVKDAWGLLAFNSVFYGLSIYLIFIGAKNKELNRILLGCFLWLIPNLYQIAFLEGLYV